MDTMEIGHLEEDFHNGCTYIVNDDGRFQISSGTIGQCVGEPDREGVWMFEGDIIEVTAPDTNEKKYRVIVFSKKFRGFYAAMEDWNKKFLIKIVPEFSKVLGNIHLHPHLLELCIRKVDK